MKQKPELDKPLEALVQVASDLRDIDGGCPWDLKQTHESMIPHLIEETYEAADALLKMQNQGSDSYENLKEELGDLLFQIVFHAQLAAENQKFTLNDVALYAAEKLIFRHPHVYGDLENVTSPDQVLSNWEKLKRTEKEKKQNKKDKSMLSGVPDHMPALLKAYRMGQKAGRVHFDWPDGPEGFEMLWSKIKEELDEFKAEIPQDIETFKDPVDSDLIRKEKAEEELGDLLFAISQLARRLHIDPEGALQKANRKFKSRFEFMELELFEKLNTGEHISLADWEIHWKNAKRAESKASN